MISTTLPKCHSVHSQELIIPSRYLNNGQAEYLLLEVQNTLKTTVFPAKIDSSAYIHHNHLRNERRDEIQIQLSQFVCMPFGVSTKHQEGQRF